MRILDHQRLVIGYHGCDVFVRDQVIRHQGKLRRSQNDYDWLGHGIYFWEHGPERALEWAEQQRTRGKIEKPAVLGALLHLGQCFDLLDAAYPDVLKKSYPKFCASFRTAGKIIPKNQPANIRDPDKLLRNRDCAVINWTIQQLEQENQTRFDSVRGVFQEGAAAFPGSGVRSHSHIQIAVRHQACILGYFLPSSEGR